MTTPNQELAKYTRAIKLLKIFDKQNKLPRATAPTIEEQQGFDEIENAIAFLKENSFGGLSMLVNLVRQWGEDKSITGLNAQATTQTQFVKLLEEVEELNVAIAVPDHDETVDAIGDCTVVLILLADLAGVRFEDCLLSAYNEIKGRTGHMSADGVFVKDSI